MNEFIKKYRFIFMLVISIFIWVPICFAIKYFIKNIDYFTPVVIYRIAWAICLIFVASTLLEIKKVLINHKNKKNNERTRYNSFYTSRPNRGK